MCNAYFNAECQKQRDFWFTKNVFNDSIGVTGIYAKTFPVEIQAVATIPENVVPLEKPFTHMTMNMLREEIGMIKCFLYVL